MPLLNIYYEPKIWLGAINTGKKLYTFALTHIKETNPQNPKVRGDEDQERKNR